MFGSKRRRARDAAVQFVMPFVRTAALYVSIPGRFFEDPYVIGFLNYCILISALQAASGRLNESDWEVIFSGVYSAVSGLNGKNIAERSARFAAERNAAFEDGKRAAEKLITVTFGVDQGELDYDPEIVAAMEAIQNSALRGMSDESSSTEAALGSYLMHSLFHQVVRERLGLGTDLDNSP